MFVEGTLRWKVTEDCPWDLLMALCLRDMAGLRDLGDPVLPALTPAVPVAAHSASSMAHRASQSRPAEGGEALRAQWLAWWSATAVRATRPFITALHPPHFAAFDRQLELQDLIEEHYAAASPWVEARRAEYLAAEASCRDAFAAGVILPVREREHRLRRQAGYFRLDLCVLPLAERGVWVIGPDTVAISRSLREDEPAFRAWWSSLVEVLV